MFCYYAHRLIHLSKNHDEMDSLSAFLPLKFALEAPEPARVKAYAKYLGKYFAHFSEQ